MTIRVNRNGRSAYEEFASEGELEGLRNSNFRFGAAGPTGTPEQEGAGITPQQAPSPRLTGPNLNNPTISDAEL